MLVFGMYNGKNKITARQSMKTLVVYRSKSGFVQRYAEWIAGDLKADLLEGSGVTVDNLTGYDAIVYGGGLYESGINGVKIITGNLDQLEGKRIADRKSVV
jgi:hypothetical protein